MVDGLSAIPVAMLRNLSDKLYEKRKNVALEVEGIVKQLTAAEDHDKINAVVNLLAHEFTNSSQANHRKGGLIGLAVAKAGLSSKVAQHLEIVAEFDWELDEFEEFTDELIAAGELSVADKDAFKEFVKEKVEQGKRANYDVNYRLINCCSVGTFII